MQTAIHRFGRVVPTRLSLNLKCAATSKRATSPCGYRAFSTPALPPKLTMTTACGDEYRKYYLVPLDTPICKLECKEAYSLLTNSEKKYAHRIARASAYGSLICSLQVSPESAYILAFLRRLFRTTSVETLKQVAKSAGVTDDEVKGFLVYACAVVHNCGNYKGFGDTKLIPDIPKDKLSRIIHASNDIVLVKLWPKCAEDMFRLEAGCERLNLAQTGVTTYHSCNVSKADSDKVNRYMQSKGLEGWNTRHFKLVRDGRTVHEIRLASVETGVVTPEEQFEDVYFTVTRGDYSELLKYVVQELELAQQDAANDHQREMLKHYVKHFTTGDLSLHKEASRHWIRDQSPAVESYIGFIENYRDPVGVRAEFEGFVALVNKDTSRKFGDLVSQSEELISRLPWPKEFEKDSFLRPDFTSIEVVYFGGSGTPAGINIPNYDEIRQNEGFKNVSLGNVIAALPNKKLPFLSDEDDVLARKHYKDAFEVQVGLHELLGHGSGKLLMEEKDGKFNFNRDLINPVTMEKISTWYKPGETWGSKFGYVSSAYEECRAEAVGYFLCCFDDILKTFGYDAEQAATIRYVNWLSEIRAGLTSLEYYSPDEKKWSQAHCHARHVLTRVVMEKGDGFVTIKEIDGADGKPDLLFSLDRSKILTTGKDAIAKFLLKLQVYKATADVEAGLALFEQYSKPTPETVRWREIVIARRQPRRVLLQPNTVLQEGGQGDPVPSLKEYPETYEGMIQSFVDRYPDEEPLNALVALADKDLLHFKTG